jgi:ABC-type phosphate transport system substrate-binding protein
MNGPSRTGTRRHAAPAMTLALWLYTAFAHAEPLAVIAHKNNPNTSLNTTTVAGMYRGEILHWPGGDRIKLVNREISANERKTFYLQVLNANPDQVFYRQGTPVPVQSVIERSDEAVVRFVGVIDGAIGYVNLSTVKALKDSQVKILLLIENR